MAEFLKVGLERKRQEPYKKQFEFLKKFLLFEQYDRKQCTSCKYIDISKSSNHQAYLPLKMEPKGSSGITIKDLVEKHFESTEATGVCKKCKRKGKHTEEKAMKGIE